MTPYLQSLLHLTPPEECSPMIPVLDSEAIRICTMPDLGSLAGPVPGRQHIVDHGFLSSPGNPWQLWACIRGTADPQNSRLIFGWEADHLLQTPWREVGIRLRGDPQLGESGVGAPFFLHWKSRYYCFYHSAGIRVLASEDGKEFTRLNNASGTNLLYQGGRDIMVCPWQDQLLFYSTITCISRDGIQRSFVTCRSTRDLENWSDPIVVSEGGIAGSGPVNAESPFVVHRQGYFYLFRATSRPTVTGGAHTFVYRSESPFHFGVHDDSRLVAVLPLKAPEIVEADGVDYISDLADFQGLVLRRLHWQRDPSTPQVTPAASA